jgi:hypothetical protein
MAAISGATTTGSSLANIVNSEFIAGEILDANRIPTVYESLCRIYDASGVMSATYTVTKWVAAAVPVSEGSPKSETDVFASTEQTMSQAQIAATVVGIMKSIGYEVLQDTVRGPQIVADLVRESVIEQRQQMNEDALGRITSATTTANYSGLDLTRARFAGAGATFHALNPYTTARPAAVFDSVQIEDLKTDLRAATGAIYGSEFGTSVGDLLNMNVSGYLGTYEGFDMFRSDVPAYDGSNTAGAMLIPNAAIGVAVWWNMLIETDPLPDRTAENLVVSSRYGTNIINQPNLVEIASANA